MGTVQYTSVVVTGYNSKLENKLTKVHKKAIKLFGKETVTQLAGDGTNGVYSFLVATSGSKLGWYTSNSYLDKVNEFIDYLNSLKYEDGSTSIKYVRVSYGELGLYVEDNRDNKLQVGE